MPVLLPRSKPAQIAGPDLLDGAPQRWARPARKVTIRVSTKRPVPLPKGCEPARLIFIDEIETPGDGVNPTGYAAKRAALMPDRREPVDTIPQITRAEIHPEEGERTAVAGSCARLVESELEAWIDSLPDPAAVARLTDVATMVGALCISEGKAGRTASDSLGARAAAYMMWEIARGLEYDDPEERKRWVEQRVIDALTILVQDREAAWERVRQELDRRNYLSGDEIRALIAESDAG